MSKAKIDWPKSWDKFFEFLDNLRDSGVTNMFGASEYLESQYGLGHKESLVVLALWMKTFEQRHPKGEKN